MRRPKMSLAERLWTRVERTEGGCWEFMGYRDKKGYGLVHQESPRASLRAHRAAWILHHQADPGDLLICHHCDNPPCVNPHHLYAGTEKDNSRDRRERGRARGNEVGGEMHYRSRLTQGQVDELRSLRAEGVLLRVLAERYGVSVPAVSSIANGRTWKQAKTIGHSA